MSWQFVNDGSQRVNEKETLLIREELISLLQLSKEDMKVWVAPDYYKHTNLLLPNPIKEKELRLLEPITFIFYPLKI